MRGVFVSQSRHWGSSFEHSFGLGVGGGGAEGEFERANLQKFKCPEGFPGRGLLKFRIDRRNDNRLKNNDL